MLTDEQIAEIEERAKAASPGPWFVRDSLVRRIYDAKGNTLFAAFGVRLESDPKELWAECDFIAAARADIPALIRHIRERESLLRRLAEGLEACREEIKDHDPERVIFATINDLLDEVHAVGPIGGGPDAQAAP